MSVVPSREARFPSKLACVSDFDERERVLPIETDVQVVFREVKHVALFNLPSASCQGALSGDLFT